MIFVINILMSISEKELFMGITLDSIKQKLLGKTFHDLTVLEYVGRSKIGENLWKCRCSCGRELVRRTSNVIAPFAACTQCKTERMLKNSPYKTYLLNQKFNKLKVISYEGIHDRGGTLWKCVCDCGNEIVVQSEYLKKGFTRSCKDCYEHPAKGVARTHGLHKHPLYAVWYQMRERCYNKNSKPFKYYGERGIGICQEWLEDFLNFYNWSMENGYQKGLSIERKDVNGHYEPNNCRWATREEQVQNRTTTKIKPDQLETIRQDPRSNAKIAKDYGVNESTISRIRAGTTWSNIT